MHAHYAGFWRRAAAWLLDLLLLCFCTSLIIIASGLPAETAAHKLSAPLLGAGVLLIPVCWTLFGGTPGKRMLDCVVVRARDHQPIGFLRALMRVIAWLLAAMPAGLGLFWIGVDRRKQGLHDKLAGTLVWRDDESQKSLAQLLEESA